MSKSNLFFRGVVLQNTRNLIEEDLARKQLQLQKESLDLRKEDLAQRRAQNRRQNAPSFKSFGQPKAGELNFYINDAINDHINMVSTDPENYTQTALNENNILTDIATLSDIDSNYKAFQSNVLAGGTTLENANYIKDKDGMYEVQKRFEIIKEQLRKKEINPEQASLIYYENTPENPLYNITKETTLGEDIISKSTISKKSYIKTVGNKDIIGIDENSIPELIEAEKKFLAIDQRKDGTYFIKTTEGKRAYFNTSFTDDNGDLVNAQNLFLNSKVTDGLGGTAPEEELKKLDPDDENFDIELAKEYTNFLATEDITRKANAIRSTTKATKEKEDNVFKDIYSKEAWEQMSDAIDVSDKKYGPYAMLKGFTFNQDDKKYNLTVEALQSMQALTSTGDTSEDLDNKTAKQYLIKQARMNENNVIPTSLNTTAISQDHRNMFAILNVTVSNEATDGKGSKTIEFIIPIANISDELLGKSPLRWKKSLRANTLDSSIYGTGEQTGGGEQTGVRVPRI